MNCRRLIIHDYKEAIMIGIKKQIYSIPAGIFLLLSLAAAFGPNRTAQAADVQQKKDVFIMETAIIDAIEGKIDDEKFDEIKKLKGKEVTGYPGTLKDSAEDAVCVDGNIVTSKGPGTAHLFGFKLAEILAGKEKAEQVKKSTLF